ncbi:MAG: Stealth CR1 domain-containing protein [Muribaculaceae bacterium]|nr:Stealth CR1 domain-containing protein [Muribaculaceae bacterium]
MGNIHKEAKFVKCFSAGIMEDVKQVDAVITWVDGKDPELAAKRRNFLEGKDSSDIDKNPEVSGQTRYVSFGEICWCVASINRFAPWIRKIYIVTDGQDPKIDEHLPKGSDINHIPVEIIDHKVIFRDFEDLLPTFNSLSIETMLWRIPGLADNYIYFNDDFFLCAPNSLADRFRGEAIVNYGRVMNTLLVGVAIKAKQMIKGKGVPMFKSAMYRAAQILNSDKLIFHQHSAIAQNKILLENYFTKHPDILRKNASYRFRSDLQFSNAALCLLLAYQEGKLINLKRNRTAFFKTEPSKGDIYIARKVEEAQKNHALQGCVNSFDLATQCQRLQFKEWINRLLDIN